MVYIHPGVAILRAFVPPSFLAFQHIMTGIVEILTARRSLRPFRAPVKASRSRFLSREEETSHTQNPSSSSSSPPCHSVSSSPSTFTSFPSTSFRSSSSSHPSSLSSSSSSSRSSCTSVSLSSVSSCSSSSVRDLPHSHSSSRSSSSLTPLLSGCLLPLSSLPSSSPLLSRAFPSRTASSSSDTSSPSHHNVMSNRRRRRVESAPDLLREVEQPPNVLRSQKEGAEDLSGLLTSPSTGFSLERIREPSFSIRRTREHITQKSIGRNLGLFTSPPITRPSPNLGRVSTEGRDEVYCHGSGVRTASSWRRRRFGMHSSIPFSLLEKPRYYNSTATAADLHLSRTHEGVEKSEASEKKEEKIESTYHPYQGHSDGREEDRLPSPPGIVEDVFEVKQKSLFSLFSSDRVCLIPSTLSTLLSFLSSLPVTWCMFLRSLRKKGKRRSRRRRSLSFSSFHCMEGCCWRINLQRSVCTHSGVHTLHPWENKGVRNHTEISFSYLIFYTSSSSSKTTHMSSSCSICLLTGSSSYSFCSFCSFFSSLIVQP